MQRRCRITRVAREWHEGGSGWALHRKGPIMADAIRDWAGFEQKVLSLSFVITDEVDKTKAPSL
jgi:hypothetical protein